MTLETGARLGHYRILGLLGRGGMADVYRAEDERLGREVALKALPPEFARDPERVARFEREVRAAAKLTHPNIVTVYEYGVGEEHPFYTMALLPGGDLKARIRTHPDGMPPAEALKVAAAMARALDYAHGQGFVHRDIKPENILFTADGTPQLTDFGIARAVSEGTRMTATGMSIGSPHYMSPEQARGQAVDGRSDLYSLGVVLYEMLTGRVPFDASDTFAVGLSHINDPVPALPGHLASWQPVLDQLLAKSPENRYGSAGELAEVLSSDAPPQAQPTRVVQRLRDIGSAAKAKDPATPVASLPKPRRGLRAALVGGVLAVVAVGIVYIALQQGTVDSERVPSNAGSGSATVQPAPVPTAPPPNPANPSNPQASPSVSVTPGSERPINPGDRFSECEDCPLMVVVPAGTFTMGSPLDEEEDRSEEEGPQHLVTIPEPFAVGMFEVTFGEWNACVADGGCNSHRPKDLTWGQPSRPVINVNWEDSGAYVNWLSAKTGGQYRLLTESEWEYAARAGTQTAYYFGPTITMDLANFGAVFGTGRSESWDKTTPVGSYSSNGFGLHDMHGNVREWVEDCWNEDYRGAPADGSAWTGGDCTQRVLRGGSWRSSADFLRSASRVAVAGRYEFAGFRVARSDLDSVATICPDPRCTDVNAAKVRHAGLELRDARTLAAALVDSFIEQLRAMGFGDQIDDEEEIAEGTAMLAEEFAAGKGGVLEEMIEDVGELGALPTLMIALESGQPLPYSGLEDTIDKAWDEGHEQIVEALIEVGVYGSQSMLAAAARVGDEYIVDKLLAAGVRPREFELLAAARNGRVNMVAKFVAAGAELERDAIDLRDQALDEEFREAIRDGDAGVVEALLLAGVQPREVDLQDAVSHNHDAIVELLARAMGKDTGTR